jgi:hypothetical protein
VTASNLAAPSSQRDWWQRTWRVLVDPRATFAALREDGDEDALARGEPLLAVLILAGIAAVLSSSAAAHLRDDPVYDSDALIAVWAFLGGAIYGLLIYWGGGLLLHFGVLSLGSHAPYRRTRQLLGFALVPLALSLLVWIPRLALYGTAWFHYAGPDRGTPAAVFGWLEVAFALWSAALLVVGVRVVEGWAWARSAGAVALAAILPALVALAVYGVL